MMISNSVIINAFGRACPTQIVVPLANKGLRRVAGIRWVGLLSPHARRRHPVRPYAALCSP